MPVRKHKVLRRIFKTAIALFLLCLLLVTAINIYVTSSVKDRILTEQQVAALGAAERPICIEVLGAAIYNGEPSPMLADRLDESLQLYKDGVSDILLFSGDNGTNEYNEVAAMRRYAIANGAPYGVTEDCIYLDYAGFSTYESMYRLRDVFGARKAVIVTQQYHLYRALYIADKLGIDAYGVAAAPTKQGQFSRDVREVLARTKDFFFVIFDVQPTFLGEAVELKAPSATQTK